MTCRQILRWFSGNIGLHHIHHLCSRRFPNYRLQACVDDGAGTQGRIAKRITLRESFGCAPDAVGRTFSGWCGFAVQGRSAPDPGQVKCSIRSCAALSVFEAQIAS